MKTRPRSEETRKLVLQTALGLFREHGFDGTTMRDIASACKLAVGAAYYHFPSKEAIVQAYYHSVQGEHERRVKEALRQGDLDLRGRMRAAIHSKLDIIAEDRRLLGAIFRYTGEPGHPLSCLGPGTRPLRQHSMAVFAEAVGSEPLPEEMLGLLPLLLWALHMAVILFFLYDDSPRQQRTRALVDNAVDLVAGLLTVVKFPLLKPLRSRGLALLSESGLLPGGEPKEAFPAMEVQP